MSARPPKAPAEKPASRSPVLWVAMLIGAVTLTLFWSATRFDFLNLDDDLYVHGNPHVTEGLTLKGLRYAFTTTDGGSWMPLPWLSFLLDAQLSGDRPAGFHATNILLHAVAAVLLFLAMVKMTGELWPSARAALLFAVHPLRLESVVWIAERKDVLGGVGFMLTLIAYARARFEAGVCRGAQQSWRGPRCPRPVRPRAF
jgi:protein O-mannosyl-transferase